MTFLEASLTQEQPPPDNTLFYPNLIQPLSFQNNSTTNGGFLSATEIWSYTDNKFTLGKNSIAVEDLLNVWLLKDQLYISTATSLNRYNY